MNLDLFDNDYSHASPEADRRVEFLSTQAVVLRAFAKPYVNELFQALKVITAQSPFRHLVTPGGHTMSVAMTNCGTLGWVSDEQGYAYGHIDPLTQLPWPKMPKVFRQLAETAAALAGFPDYQPDACLINRYAAGAKLSLHQDRNELGTSIPIVSVSLGIPATFLLGGFERQAATQKVALCHSDVMVWGGVDRMRFHGVLPIKPAYHSLFGEYRINLTFRRVRDIHHAR